MQHYKQRVLIKMMDRLLIPMATKTRTAVAIKTLPTITMMMVLMAISIW